MHNTRQGFTLIELMVSIALMLLLIGIVMSIFNNSSTTVTMAEAKVEIFQNARTTFEAMAQEIADATEICIYNATESFWKDIDIATENIISENIEKPRPSLTMKTITHWIQNNINTSEEALVQYTIQPMRVFNGEILFSLRKTIFGKQKDDIKIYDKIISSDILSEYLTFPVNPNDNSIAHPTQNLPIYIERLKENSNNTSWGWDGDDYQTRLARLRLDNDIYRWNNEDKRTTTYNSLPVAIRITMTFTDEFVRAKRTVSRVFWIPKGK